MRELKNGDGKTRSESDHEQSPNKPCSGNYENKVLRQAPMISFLFGLLRPANFLRLLMILSIIWPLLSECYSFRRD